MYRVVAAHIITLTFCLTARSATADFGCSTVTHNGLLDPEGQVLSTSFGAEVAIGGTGDTLFTARPTGRREHLYLYPTAGSPEIVAPASGFAPNGGAFRSTRAFSALSINDAGDVAFHGRLVAGTGIFARESGGSLEVAAETTGVVPAPIGGFFKSFASVSRISADGKVAFIASVVNGTASSAVFLYDAPNDTGSVVMALNDVTTGGRELCAFHAVGIGDTGIVAVRATSKLDCADPMEVTPRDGIFFHDGVAIQTAALEGDPAPVGGTTFTSFEQAPLVNANDRIAFRATVGGLVTRNGIFLHDPSGPSTQSVVLRGDAAPTGGAVGKISTFSLDDVENVIVRSSVIGSPVNFGVFIFDGLMETALASNSTPPMDLFSPGASYLRMGDAGASRDGDHVGIKVRIRDPQAPRNRRAVLRCER